MDYNCSMLSSPSSILNSSQQHPSEHAFSAHSSHQASNMPQSENRRLLGKSCPSSARTREGQRVESSSLGLDTLSVGMHLPMLGGKIYLTIVKEARERGKTRSGHPEHSKCCHPANSRLPSGEQGRPTVHHRPCKSVLSKNLHRTYKRGL